MTTRFFLSFVTNFKDENRYLKEWLNYHIGVGVDHFYLINQDDSEESKKILQPYEKAGYVTQYDWSHLKNKLEGPTFFFQKNRNHLGNITVAKNHRHETRWLLKIDVDEFLFSKHSSKNVSELIASYDSTKIKYLRIPRIDFGNSGLITPPKGGVLSNYTRRESGSSNYKDCASTLFLNNNSYCYSQHYWSYKWSKKGLALALNDQDDLRINHYYTKSKEEYFQRQNISRGRRLSEEDFEKIAQRCNEVFDDSILKDIPSDSFP